MLSSKKILLPAIAILLLSNPFAATAFAELVMFQFTGRTQATIDSTFYSNVAFEASVSIDDSATDQFPFQNGRGAFSGATTILSIPSAGISDAQSTNVTGILQEDFGGNPRFRLVDPSNYYGSAGLGVGWNTAGVIPDANTINPLTEPVSTPNNFEGGLSWEFLLGPNVTFHSVFEVAVTNVSASANVPEPTSFTMFGMGLLGIMAKRRRRPRVN